MAHVLEWKEDESLEKLLLSIQANSAGKQESLPLDPARLSQILQTTLDIETLITLFSKSIRPALAQHSITFQHPELKQAITHGKIQAFELSYDIHLKGENLGSLTLSRKWEFNAADRQILEFTLYNLFYPLRNALTYFRALQAAQRDALTGVRNRTCFEESMNREIDIAKRTMRDLSLVVVDIDHFKAINDQFGHSLGDCVIRRVADEISRCMRKSDMLFRYGGEEFVLILSSTTLMGAKRLAERIRKCVEQIPCECDTQQYEGLKVTISLGIASLSKTDDLNSLFDRADNAMYDAKQSGRNKVCVREK